MPRIVFQQYTPGMPESINCIREEKFSFTEGVIKSMEAGWNTGVCPCYPKAQVIKYSQGVYPGNGPIVCRLCRYSDNVTIFTGGGTEQTVSK